MNSAGYTPAPDLSHLNAAILILHGAADSPADGGGTLSAVGNARAFEAALRTANKPVEAHYYPNGTHNGLFANPRQWRDEVRRILQFLDRHFR
jgi:dipeptidyl aminopeptidase/acylaminoacyl peptidase